MPISEKTPSTKREEYNPRFHSDSLAPGYDVYHLPVLKTISEFRRSVLEQGDGSDHTIKEWGARLLCLLHFVTTGEKVPEREIKSVSIGTLWNRGGDMGLLVEIVDLRDHPWKYTIEPDTYLSSDPRHVEVTKDARENVRLTNLAVEEAARNHLVLLGRLAAAKAQLEELDGE